MAPPDDIQARAEQSRKALLAKQAALREKVARSLSSVQAKVLYELRAITGLITDYKLAGLEPSPSMLYQQARLFKLRKQISDAIDAAAPKLAEVTAEAQNAAAEQAMAEAKALKAADTLDSEIFHFDVKPIEKLIGFAADDARTPLAAMFKRIGEPLARAVESKLVYALATGQNNNALTREIKSILNTTTAHALTIARTETNNAYREASRSIYDDNKDALAGYMWIAALDLRTCPICWRFHGKIFKTAAKFRTHPNCRCTLVAVPKKSKEIVKTGEQTFAELTEAQQKTILGGGRLELYKAGAKLEHLVGYKKTPYGETPVLIPIDDVVIPKAGKKAAAIAKPKAPKPELSDAKVKELVDFTPKPAAPIGETPKPLVETGFPADIASLTEVKTLGGSTGAKLVKDRAERLYVLKTGNSAEHIREEFTADEVYRALGVAVPRAKLYEEGGKTYKLAEYIEGRSLASLSGKELEIARAELRKDFAADALLGNRDVIGLEADNILVDKAGKVWRIDNGSSFRFRAQGGAKDYDGFLDELWTLRDPKINAQSSAVFGSVDYYDLGRQMRKLATAEIRAKALAIVPDELKAALESRLSIMADLGQYADDLEKGDWLADYADEVSKHINGLRRSGIIDDLPRSLTSRKPEPASVGEFDETPTKFIDENGHLFDSLRTRPKYGGGLISRLEDYINKIGGNNSIIRDWQEQQAGSSWGDKVQAFKYFLSKVTKIDDDDVYWRYGKNAAKLEYEKVLGNMYGDDPAGVYRRSHAAYKAFVMEFLAKTDFHNNNRLARTITLLRTEDYGVINGKYGFKQGARKKTMDRGLSESYSIIKRFTFQGRENTVQTIAHTDIHGSYFFNKQGSSFDSGSYAGDNENEFTAMYRKKKFTFDYVKNTELPKRGFSY